MKSGAANTGRRRQANGFCWRPPCGRMFHAEWFRTGRPHGGLLHLVV